ncbi:MAG: NifB/NifX family molybdenum-iron cluster-binding protein [Anaerovoracaceae bacterium]
MIVALPMDEKSLAAIVANNFGRATYYLFYDMENDTVSFINNTAAMSRGGAGIKAAQIIVDNKADVLLTPRCGENAADVLLESKIEIYRSIEGTAQTNIDAFKAGKLQPLSEIHPGLHGH